MSSCLSEQDQPGLEVPAAKRAAAHDTQYTAATASPAGAETPSAGMHVPRTNGSTSKRAFTFTSASSQTAGTQAPLGSSKPAPPANVVDWERAMDAKLAQWRYMNLVAVSELQREEQEQCGRISALATELESVMDEVASLTRALDTVRAVGAGETFASRASQPLRRLVESIGSMQGAHRVICERVCESLHQIQLRGVVVGSPEPETRNPPSSPSSVLEPGSPAALVREMKRFRVAAAEFARVAEKHGASEDCAVALEDLARCVAEEAPGVRQAMCQTVAEAITALEENAAARAASISKRRRSKRASSASPSSTVLAPGIDPKADSTSSSLRPLGDADSAHATDGPQRSLSRSRSSSQGIVRSQSTKDRTANSASAVSASDDFATGSTSSTSAYRPALPAKMSLRASQSTSGIGTRRVVSGLRGDSASPLSQSSFPGKMRRSSRGISATSPAMLPARTAA